MHIRSGCLGFIGLRNISVICRYEFGAHWQSPLPHSPTLPNPPENASFVILLKVNIFTFFPYSSFYTLELRAARLVRVRPIKIHMLESPRVKILSVSRFSVCDRWRVTFYLLIQLCIFDETKHGNTFTNRRYRGIDSIVRGNWSVWIVMEVRCAIVRKRHFAREVGTSNEHMQWGLSCSDLLPWKHDPQILDINYKNI